MFPKRYYLMTEKESDWVQNKLVELYDSISNKGELEHYKRHGLDFEYALIDANALRGRSSGIHWIDKWMYYYGYAFAISRSPDEGMSLIFVCSDDVPEKFRGITAVHEYGDMINQHAGSRDERHKSSIKLELDIAKKDGLYDEYIEWIRKRWKSRIEEFSRLGIEI